MLQTGSGAIAAETDDPDYDAARAIGAGCTQANAAQSLLGAGRVVVRLVKP